MGADVAQETAQSQEKSERVRSKILFPYSDLDDAINIARGVHSIGGSSCQADQLAAKLGQNGSGFQVSVNTARTFGLAVSSQGTITLTPLGARICDPQQEKAARAESFLTVPLYKKLYEDFKGGTLPPAGGLDTAVVNMGVPPKQKETARRTFQRSAQQAGFFAFAQDRLVYPSIKGSGELPPAAAGENPVNKEENLKSGNGGDGGGGESRHPFIEGLIKTLPAPESPWPIEKRMKWLQAASHVFDLIYEDSGNGGSLKIEIEKDSAK